MATRLLSFLSDIEQALVKASAANMGPTWAVTRIVSYHQGLARMTLEPPLDAEAGTPAGAILLQSFTLADGSLCLKASLSWKSSEAVPVISVYSTPATRWKNEALHIATDWLAGPPASLAPVLEELPTIKAATA